jgi:hypothetical protein
MNIRLFKQVILSSLIVCSTLAKAQAEVCKAKPGFGYSSCDQVGAKIVITSPAFKIGVKYYLIVSTDPDTYYGPGLGV